MAELSVIILAQDNESRTVLQMLVDNTAVARTIYSAPSVPVASTDPLLRRISDLKPDVIILDIPASSATSMLRGIELLHTELPDSAIFAVGEMTQPQIIVSAMRAGAREYIERPPTTSHMLEAFVRITTAQRKSQRNTARGRIFTVVNAKGGSGATTVAVNLTLALQQAHGNVAIIDLAPLGHTALHLNVKPHFTIGDVLKNLHRLDGSLLEGYMIRHSNGAHLLAGANDPVQVQPSPVDFAKLFDLLVNHYRYVVVDASSRLDPVTRIVSDSSDAVLIVAQTDVPSLWSASRVQQYLSETGTRDRLRLVLNRYKKIPGFGDSDAEAATSTKLIGKIPNQYPAVSASIDRGIPVAQQNHSEIARSFVSLASSLTDSGDENKTRSWSLFKTA